MWISKRKWVDTIGRLEERLGWHMKRIEALEVREPQEPQMDCDTDVRELLFFIPNSTKRVGVADVVRLILNHLNLGVKRVAASERVELQERQFQYQQWPPQQSVSAAVKQMAKKPRRK